MENGRSLEHVSSPDWAAVCKADVCKLAEARAAVARDPSTPKMGTVGGASNLIGEIQSPTLTPMSRKANRLQQCALFMAAG